MKDFTKGLVKGTAGTYMGVVGGTLFAVMGTGLSGLLGFCTTAVAYFATGILMPKLLIGIALGGAVISAGLGIHEGVKDYKLIKNFPYKLNDKPTKNHKMGIKLGVAFAAASMVLGGYKLVETFNNSATFKQLKTELNQKPNTPTPQNFNKKEGFSI